MGGRALRCAFRWASEWSTRCPCTAPTPGPTPTPVPVPPQPPPHPTHTHRMRKLLHCQPSWCAPVSVGRQLCGGGTEGAGDQSSALRWHGAWRRGQQVQMLEEGRPSTQAYTGLPCHTIPHHSIPRPPRHAPCRGLGRTRDPQPGRGTAWSCSACPAAASAAGWVRCSSSRQQQQQRCRSTERSRRQRAARWCGQATLRPVNPLSPPPPAPRCCPRPPAPPR